MISFQQDFLNIIKNKHDLYNIKMQTLLSNPDLLECLSLDNAENIIEYIKEYNKLIYSVSLTIDKINNVKKINNINEKIDKELMVKIMPIMNIYRILLLEKYKDEFDRVNNQSSINEND